MDLIGKLDAAGHSRVGNRLPTPSEQFLGGDWSSSAAYQYRRSRANPRLVSPSTIFSSHTVQCRLMLHLTNSGVILQCHLDTKSICPRLVPWFDLGASYFRPGMEGV